MCQSDIKTWSVFHDNYVSIIYKFPIFFPTWKEKAFTLDIVAFAFIDVFSNSVVLDKAVVFNWTGILNEWGALTG